jgi:hypothetical protein
MKIQIYKTVMFAVVYGHETWSLTIWEEHGVWVFGSWVLRIIFGFKRKELSEGGRKLHGEDLHNLHSSVDIIGGYRILDCKLEEAFCKHGRDEKCL